MTTQAVLLEPRPVVPLKQSRKSSSCRQYRQKISDSRLSNWTLLLSSRSAHRLRPMGSVETEGTTTVMGYQPHSTSQYGFKTNEKSHRGALSRQEHVDYRVHAVSLSWRDLKISFKFTTNDLSSVSFLHLNTTRNRSFENHQPRFPLDAFLDADSPPDKKSTNHDYIQG
jgi:hypothetical protein